MNAHASIYFQGILASVRKKTLSTYPSSEREMLNCGTDSQISYVFVLCLVMESYCFSITSVI